MGATLASLPTAVWAHLLSVGESSSSNAGGVDLNSQQQHLQSLSSSDAFHQCGSGISSNPHPLSHHLWETQVDMDYSSAAAAHHHYMMAPPPQPNSLSLLSSSHGSNVHIGHGQWNSPGGEQRLQSSGSLLPQHQQHHQHHQHHQQQVQHHQHQHQQQQHRSDFQEQFAPHPHIVANAHVTHLHESPEEGRDAAKRSTAALKHGTGEEMSSSDSYKRPRLEQPTPPFKPQVRKEKLGERITALQQLVSPFGKTDTASVLQEAIGYIKFLQDQVQVLSTPYMKPTMNSGSGNHHDSQELGGISSWASSNAKSTEDVRQDLRSRGLCLVPVSCTLQVANDNGADFWTPAVGGGCR